LTNQGKTMNKNIERNKCSVAEIAASEAAAPGMFAPKRKFHIANGRKQRGFSLLDVALAGLVASLISLAAYAAYHETSDDGRGSNLVEESTKMMGKVSKAYNGNFANISNTTLIQNGYLKGKTTMTVSGATIKTKPGNGTLSVTPGQLIDPNDAATWTFTDQPDSTCADMVGQLDTVAGQITVNSTIVKAVKGTLDPSQISCNTGANSIVAVVD
jgi:hypothetical protein